MITSQDIPAEWRNLLLQVHKTDRLAMISGGCLRDLENGRMALIKDIDIIVQNQTDIYKLAKTLGGKEINITEVESSAQDANFSSEVKFRIEGMSHPINLIQSIPKLDPLDKTMQNDFGICQIGYGGNTILRSNLYRTDSEHHTMTLARCRSEYEWFAVLKHYARLYEKYEWNLVLPWRFAYAIATGDFTGAVT